jgi:predicted negative regulator of RcsB-dependent stress response
MTGSTKEHAKELKAPDALQVRLAKVLKWILDNAQYLAYAAAPVLVGVAIFYGYQSFQERRQNGRLEELGKVHVVYEREERAAADQRKAISDKIEALAAKATASTSKEGAKDIKGAGSEVTAPKDAQTAAEEERLKKELNAVRANHGESLKGYQDYAAKNPSTAEGWLAAFMAAQILAEDQKLAESRDLLVGLLDRAKDAPFYQVQPRLFLAGIQADLGAYDDALAQLDTLDSSLDKLGMKDVKSKVLLTRGRIQILKKADEEAKKTFATILDQYGDSPEAQKARGYQTLLN